MKPFQHVIFPVDFSPLCESTVPHVKRMVQSYNTRLTLLHTIEVPFYSYGSMPSDAAIAWQSFDDIYKSGQQKLQAFKIQHFSDLGNLISVNTACDLGDPGYAILARAEKTGADLIMMSTYGHGAFRGFMLGSNTARVLHRAACAVWTGAHSEQDAGLHLDIKKILCALDLEHESGYVLDAAAALAARFSAQVCVIHCVPVPEDTSSKDYDRDGGWNGHHCRLGLHQLGFGGLCPLIIRPLSNPATYLRSPRSNARDGSHLAIVGAGPIGLAALLTAQVYSPSEIIMIDLDENRLDVARQFGATATINGSDGRASNTVMKMTQGRGVDTAIEAVGVPASFLTCQDIIAPGGVIANVGVHGVKVELHLEYLWSRNITITTRLLDTITIPMLLKSVYSEKLKPKRLVTHRFSLDRVIDAYDTFEDARRTKALKVLLTTSGAGL